MSHVVWTFSALVLALVFDRVVGDPDWVWSRVTHPVVVIGGAIGRLEAWLNRPAIPPTGRRWRGLAALAILCAGGAACGAILHSSFSAFRFGFVPEALAASILLAQKGLVDHVTAVAEALDTDGLRGGRSAVAQIVGRDVSVLDQSGIARAAIESAAENFSDGLVAPAFWFALFGLPGLLVFKIASTADSMVGHRSQRYAAFGWAAARFDDLLNLAPARISAALICLAALVTRLPAGAAWRAAISDAGLHRSPNAGWPEAAAAGALGLALGGPRRYDGGDSDSEVAGAWLHPQGRPAATAADIRAAARLIDAAWTVTVLLALAALILFATAR